MVICAPELLRYVQIHVLVPPFGPLSFMITLAPFALEMHPPPVAISVVLQSTVTLPVAVVAMFVQLVRRVISILR